MEVPVPASKVFWELLSTTVGLTPGVKRNRQPPRKPTTFELKR
jgi:hypothetical protein